MEHSRESDVKESASHPFNSLESFITFEMIKRVCKPIIRIQLGHAKPTRNQLLDPTGKMGVGIVTHQLTGSALKVGKLASDQPTYTHNPPGTPRHVIG